MLALKKAVQAYCRSLVLNKISELQTCMADIQEAINNESKSSAGDKFETAREMLEQDLQVQQLQLSELLKQKDILERLNPAEVAKMVASGSLIKTSKGTYYLTVSLGNVKLDGETYYVISPKSPVGLVLMGKKKGDAIQFNGREIQILEIA